MTAREIEIEAERIFREYVARRRLAARYKGKDEKRYPQNKLAAEQLHKRLRELLGKREADRRVASPLPFAVQNKYRALCATYGKRPTDTTEKDFAKLVQRYGSKEAMRRVMAKWGPAPSAASKMQAANLNAAPPKIPAKSAERQKRLTQYDTFNARLEQKMKRKDASFAEHAPAFIDAMLTIALAGRDLRDSSFDKVYGAGAEPKPEKEHARKPQRAGRGTGIRSRRVAQTTPRALPKPPDAGKA